jgi:hypothetical protein
MYIKWLEFWALDSIWGNGESIFKLARTVLVLLIVMSILDMALFRAPQAIGFPQAFVSAPQALLGTFNPAEYPGWYKAFLAGAKLVAIGAFMSIVIKRFSRR